MNHDETNPRLAFWLNQAVPYLLAVVFFIVHVLEEYVAGFWLAMSALTGREIPEFNFMLVAAFIGPVLWLGGFILFYLRTEIGNYLVWAFIVAMTVSELAHFAFPFMAEGRIAYFPGLYTAVLPFIPALICGIRLVNHSRRPQRVDAGTHVPDALARTRW